MSKFPLYNDLLNQVPNRDLTVVQKKSFLKKIQQIDQNGYELLYALIRTYDNENKTSSTGFTIPYGGVYKNNDIQFNLHNFPKELRHILYKFVNKHLSRMKEEKKLNKS